MGKFNMFKIEYLLILKPKYIFGWHFTGEFKFKCSLSVKTKI